MKTTKKTCDRCGRVPQHNGMVKNPTGDDYHWVTVRIKGQIYLYDDGTEDHDNTYDLCHACKLVIWDVLGEKDPIHGDKEARERFQAKIRKGYKGQ